MPAVWASAIGGLAAFDLADVSPAANAPRPSVEARQPLARAAFPGPAPTGARENASSFRRIKP